MKKANTYLLSSLTIVITTLLHVSIGKLPPLGKLLDPFHGFWQNAATQPLPPSPPVALADLQDSVTIYFDEHLIPHIQAQNDADLYFAQGYVTALHRLWQMEFQTHTAAGRLSEILGTQAINFDRLQRRKGTLYAAKNALQNLEADSVLWSLVQAYTAGVNAYIASLAYKDLPIEYKLLDYRPEPWTPLKIALLCIKMADQLNGYDESLGNTHALQCLGKEKFSFLYPEQVAGQAPVIPKNTPWNFHPIPIKTAPSTIAAPIALQTNLAQTNPAYGSNNWAVASKKTLSRAPYLANDPHLALHLPAIWYGVHLHSPTVNVAGVTIPGMPGVAIGFNEAIAWGVTNAAWTLRDWYLIDFKDATREEYHYDSLLLKSQSVIEEIKVKNKASFHDTVVYTHLGPIVYDESFSAQHQQHNLAMKWVGHQPGNELRTLYLLNRAQNLKDFEDALQHYHVPAQNFAFASVQHDIAMEIAGHFPIRWKDQGRFIMPGNSAAYAWQNFIPKAHHPKIVNPSQGYVSSANERPTDKTYPYYYLQYCEEHYRNRRINQVLNQAKNVDEKTMMQLQNDNYNLPAQENLALLLGYVDTTQLDASQQEAYQTLLDWNFQNEADQVAPSIFKAWQEQLNAKLWGALHKNGISVPRPSLYHTMYILRHHPKSPHLDLGEYDTLQALISDAFKQAVQALVSWEKVHHKPYQWGDYRETSIQHLAKIDPFGLQKLRVNGGEYIVNANNGCYGVSMRLVVSLEQPPKGWLSYPGGQSGNPGNPHYTQFVAAWCQGQYIPIALTQADRTAAGGFTWILQP